MFSRLSKTAGRIKYLFFDWIKTRFQQMFTPSQSNMLSIRVVPGKHIVVVSPYKMPATTATKLLKEITPASENKARRIYNFIPFYTGAMPFLSLPDAEALPIRKKRIVPYLHAMLKNINFSAEMTGLIEKLRLDQTAQPRAEIIGDHFIDLFARNLLGVEFPEELKKSLKQTDSDYSILFCLLPPAAANWLTLIPSIRKLRNVCHTEIRRFLVDTIGKIKTDDFHFKQMKKNFLLDLILEKKGDPKLLSNKDIEDLAADPEVKLCVAVVLATNNLTRAMSFLVGCLTTAIQTNLLIELLDQESIQPTDLLQQKKMPLLHATYLETLRYAARTGIIRNIQSEIRIDDINIPANSLVMFPFDSSSQMGSAKYPCYQFAPERFLDEQKQLRPEMKLQEGVFTPFGIGSRNCPGQRISEQMIKIYLVTLLNAVKKFSSYKYTFYDEPAGDTARNFVLTYSIRSSLFNPFKGKEEQEVAEKITENIVGYCL